MSVIVYCMRRPMRDMDHFDHRRLRDDITGDTKAAAKAKLFLIFALFVACGSVVGAAVLMVSLYVVLLKQCIIVTMFSF